MNEAQKKAGDVKPTMKAGQNIVSGTKMQQYGDVQN
jgi:hypothetical protein